LRWPNGEAIWPWEFGASPQTPKTKTLKRFGSASLPFLRCKFFALQKTYETTVVAGLHAFDITANAVGYRCLSW
jgi:hypothetical protein